MQRAKQFTYSPAPSTCARQSPGPFANPFLQKCPATGSSRRNGHNFLRGMQSFWFVNPQRSQLFLFVIQFHFFLNFFICAFVFKNKILLFLASFGTFQFKMRTSDRGLKQWRTHLQTHAHILMWAIVLDAVYETNGTFVIFINSTLASLLPIVNGGVRLPAGYHDNNPLRRTGNSKFALPLLVFFFLRSLWHKVQLGFWRGRWWWRWWGVWDAEQKSKEAGGWSVRRTLAFLRISV